VPGASVTGDGSRSELFHLSQELQKAARSTKFWAARPGDGIILPHAGNAFQRRGGTPQRRLLQGANMAGMQLNTLWFCRGSGGQLTVLWELLSLQKKIGIRADSTGIANFHTAS